MSAHAGEERRRLILDHARDQGRVLVAELATTLDVAAETVRRDLQVLEDRGLVRRSHGGARPVEKAGYETHFDDRSKQAATEKARIADAAVAMLEPYESLFIDEGSTALAVADRLRATARPLTVVTHSLAVASHLAGRPGTGLIVLGGRLRSASMATVGSHATGMLADLTIDAAVLGASGISLERGLSAPDPETADLKRVAVRVARRRVFVGDHTKFGVSSFCRFAGVEELHAVITDSGLPSALAARYRAACARVVRA